VAAASLLLDSLQRFSAARVGVLGDLMIDRFVYGEVERISPEAPVPVVAVRRRVTQPGGAANTAVNVLSLGGQLRLFGVLGDDAAAAEVLELLRRRGADTAGVQLAPGRASTVKTRVVARSQQVVRFDEEDTSPLPGTVGAALLASLRAALPGLDLLVISDYAKGVVSHGLATELIAACRGAGVRVVADPKPVNAGCFAGADVIKPNLHEALRLAGWEHAADDSAMGGLCRLVRERTGVPGVVVTAGARGVYVLEGEALTHLPGAAREVYDVAGAGDSVLAALALGLASGLGLTDAARLGNLAGSIAVGHLGVAAVTQDELRAALEGGHDQAAP
jgi:D-beta-D-heptose 7-phosphate kinase/D-beta-D-heptose 1-phosphate adenosyltransferase